ELDRIGSAGCRPQVAQWQYYRLRVVEQRGDPGAVAPALAGAVERIAGKAVDFFHLSSRVFAGSLGGVLGFGAGELFRVDNGLVDRVAGGTEIGELAVDTVALQYIAGGHRLAADLVSGGALDNRPVHAAGAALFLDIVKAAI